jgi:amino acid transporter
MSTSSTEEAITASEMPRLDLRHNCVSLVENFAQTLGVLSPVGTISVIIPLLIATAGNGTWLLLLVTLSIFLVVMLSVLRFASLHSSAGSLAAFARLGLGPWGGLIGGWVYVMGMFYCVPSAILASASYCDLLLIPKFGVSGSAVRAELIAMVLTVGIWLAAHRSIKLSTNLMLVIECSSLVLVLFLLIAGMLHSHAWVDHAQIRLSGVHFSGMQGGLVLAFMLMAGFEGATSLGEEAQNPMTSIPRAILSCMLPLALLYLLVTYCIVSLENRGVIAGQVNGLTVPFDNLAHAINAPWLGPMSSLSVALSYFACGLASLTIASRVLFAMSRDGHWWLGFGKAHPTNGTPHRAIALISILSIGVPLGMLIAGTDFGVSFNFMTQLGSIGVVGAYLLVVVALPLYLRRQHELKGRDLGVAVVAASLLGLVLVLSVYPAPAPPFGYVSYVFLASVGVCLAVSLTRPGRRDKRPWTEMTRVPATLDAASSRDSG